MSQQQTLISWSAIALLICLSTAELHAQYQTTESDFAAAVAIYVAARDSGDERDALETARLAVDIASELFDESDIRIGEAQAMLGAALLSSGQKEHARQVLTEAAKLIRNSDGKHSSKLIPVYMDLADASAEFHFATNQIGYYRRALGIVARLEGKNSTRYAGISMRAGNKILSESWTNKGLPFLFTAYDIYVDTLGPLSEEAGAAAYHIGKTRFSERRFKAALKHLNVALAAFEVGNGERLEGELVTRALLVQTYENMGESNRSTEHCLVIARKSPTRADSDVEPIFEVTPEYPERAIRAQLEGHVDLRYSIDEEGFVRDLVVLESSNPVFEDAALEAAETYRYAPRIVDGTPVSRHSIQRRMTFALSDRRHVPMRFD